MNHQNKEKLEMKIMYILLPLVFLLFGSSNGANIRRYERSPNGDHVCMLKSNEDIAGKCGEGDLGELVSLNELRNTDIENTEFSYGAANEGDLVLTRVGIFFNNWDEPAIASEFVKDKYICKKHRLQLGSKWHHNTANFKWKKQAGKYGRACMWKSVEGAAEHATPVFSQPHT